MAVAKRKSNPVNAVLEGDDVVVSREQVPRTAGELIEALARLPITAADLRRLVELTQSAVTEDLSRRVAAIKAGRDGADLPVGVIKQDLVKYHRCQCDAALVWTAND